MRHTQHLLLAGNLCHLLCHLLRRSTGHAGIHLVKDHSAQLFLLRKHIFHGQHNPGQLAAGGDLLNRTKLLPHVGRHQKANLVHAGGIQLLLRKCNLKPDRAHIQFLQLRQDLFFKRLGCSLTLLRQLPGSSRCLLQRFFPMLFQLRQSVIRKSDLIQLLPALFQIRHHILYSCAIFFLQPIELITAKLYCIQLTWGKIKLVLLILHRIGDVI